MMGVRVAPMLIAFLLAWPRPAGAGMDHGALDRLLRAHVRAGRVDYDGIKRSGRAALDGYVEAIGRAKLAGASRQERLAFYLNAYNALVIHAVVGRLPGLKSVMDVKGFFKQVKRRVAGRSVTLDALENEIIRPTFKDARVHFALVCAARSCPPIGSRAFSAATVDKTLERLTARFINSRRGVRVAGDELRVSKLFQWYADDFRAAAGTVGKFLAKYHKGAAPQLRKATSLTYLPYDWSLNGK